MKSKDISACVFHLKQTTRSIVHVAVLVSFLISSTGTLHAQTAERRTLAPGSIFSEEDAVYFDETGESQSAPEVMRGGRWPWLTGMLLKTGLKGLPLDAVQVTVEQLLWAGVSITGAWYGMTLPQSLSTAAFLFGILHLVATKPGERVMPGFRDVLLVSLLNISVIALAGASPVSLIIAVLFIAGPAHVLYNRYLDEHERMFRRLARVNGEYYVRFIGIIGDRTIDSPEKQKKINDLYEELLEAVPARYKKYYVQGVERFNEELRANKALVDLNKGSEVEYLLNDSVDRGFVDGIDRDTVLSRSRGNVSYYELYPGVPLLVMSEDYYSYYDRTVLGYDYETAGFAFTAGAGGLKPTYCIVPRYAGGDASDMTLTHEVQHLVWGLLARSGLVKDIHESPAERAKLFMRFRKELCSAIASEEDVITLAPEELAVSTDKKDLAHADAEKNFIGICIKMAAAGGVSQEAFFHAAIQSANFDELRRNCLRLVPLHVITNDDVIRVLYRNDLLTDNKEYAEKAKEFIRAAQIRIPPGYIREYAAKLSKSARIIKAVTFEDILKARLEDESKKRDGEKAGRAPLTPRKGTGADGPLNDLVDLAILSSNDRDWRKLLGVIAQVKDRILETPEEDMEYLHRLKEVEDMLGMVKAEIGPDAPPWIDRMKRVVSGYVGKEDHKNLAGEMRRVFARDVMRPLPVSTTIYRDNYPVDARRFAHVLGSEEYARFDDAVRGLNAIVNSGRGLSVEDVRLWNETIGKARGPMRPMVLEQIRYGEFRSAFQEFGLWWLIHRINRHYRAGMRPKSPELLAADTLCLIVNNHPFRNGNHRTGILLMLYILARSGLALDLDDTAVSELRYMTERGKLDKDALCAFISRRVCKPAAPAPSAVERPSLDMLIEADIGVNVSK